MRRNAHPRQSHEVQAGSTLLGDFPSVPIARVKSTPFRESKLPISRVNEAAVRFPDTRPACPARRSVEPITRKLLAPEITILNLYRSQDPESDWFCSLNKAKAHGVEVGLSSLTEYPLTISTLVTSSGPDAPESASDRPPLTDAGAWGAFSQLNAFQPVTPSARAVCPRGST